MNGSGVQGNGSAWGAPPAPTGSQTAFIQNTSRISQTVSLNAGTYALSFKVAPRAYSVPAGTVQPISVSVDGQQISTVTPPNANFSPISLQFSVAASGSHTISFAGTDASGDKTTFIDEVSINVGSSVNQPVNASFETPALAGGFRYAPTGAGLGWTFVNGGAGIQSNGSAWGASSAPDGTQTAFIQDTGALAQTISLPAGSYVLKFQIAARAYSSPAGAVQPIRVTLDGQQIGSDVVPTSTNFSAVSIPFTITTSDAHTFQFAGVDASGDKSTFIDAVTISQ